MKYKTLIIILFMAAAFNAPAMAGTRPGNLGGCEDGGDMAACDALINSDKFKAGKYNKDDIVRAYYVRGSGYCKKGQYDKAIRDLNKAISLGGDWGSESYRIRGVAYNRKHQYDKAIADYDKAIHYLEAIPMSPHSFDSSLAPLYHDRGVAKQKKGNNDGAAADFAKAKELGYSGATSSVCRESD